MADTSPTWQAQQIVDGPGSIEERQAALEVLAAQQPDEMARNAVLQYSEHLFEEQQVAAQPPPKGRLKGILSAFEQ